MRVFEMPILSTSLYQKYKMFSFEKYLASVHSPIKVLAVSKLALSVYLLAKKFELHRS